MKKIFIYLAVLSFLNFLIVSRISHNSTRNLNLKMLNYRAFASDEDPYPNGQAGDTYTCGIWDNSCFCYIPGCVVWCIPDGYHCVVTPCTYGPAC